MPHAWEDFLEIKNYYSEITNSNLDLIKRLKEEHSTIKRRENEDAKKMALRTAIVCFVEQTRVPIAWHAWLANRA